MRAPGGEQIERQGHARQEVCGQPIRVDQRADFAVGSLAPGGMGDCGVEEIAAAPARRLRDAAAEFAAFAILVDIAADWQAPLFAPERLELGARQTGTAYRAVRGPDVS